MGFYKYLYKSKPGTLAYYLDQLSKLKPDLFVVQVGANDGMTHDPIHKFIKRDKWHGVLMEPQTHVFEKYLSGLYKKQPGIEVVNAALGFEDGLATLYCIGFSSARWATGLASFERAVLEKSFESEHVLRQAKKENVKIPEDRDRWIVEIEVPVLSVDALLQRYNIRKIDLLQIDTEGFDFKIIKMFDFDKIKPAAISYENMHLSVEDKNTCEKYLVKNKYQLKHFGGNTLAHLGILD